MISEAIDRGDFYASTGVELAEYAADPTRSRIKVKPTTWSRYRVQFIGGAGGCCPRSTDSNAAYAVRGDEGYVRVKVLESNGLMAWTQPVPVGRGGRVPH